MGRDKRSELEAQLEKLELLQDMLDAGIVDTFLYRVRVVAYAGLLLIPLTLFGAVKCGLL